jgi:hypothetical protein
MESKYKYIEIKHDKSGEVIQRWDASKDTDRNIERFIGGVSINLNHAEYSVSCNRTDSELPIIK